MPDDETTTDEGTLPEPVTPDTEPETPQGGKEPDWKREARKHEREAKAARSELETLRAKHQTAEEKALADAKEAGRTEATGELGTEVQTLRMELAVLKSDAAKKMADPTDALRLLDPATFTADDGTLDAKALSTALDKLLEAKPYLAAGAPVPKVPGGPRGVEPSGTDGNEWLRRQLRG